MNIYKLWRTLSITHISIKSKTYSYTSQFIVTMDTRNEPATFFHTGPDYALKFFQQLKGLYYFDTSAPNVIKNFIDAHSFLSTVQENQKLFYRDEIEVPSQEW